MSSKIIAIDFDGTCVSHEFPNIGAEIGAAPVLKELVENGHQLILWTVRSDKMDPEDSPVPAETDGASGPFLSQAVGWFESHGIPLFGVNSNPVQWTTSPKAYANLYIDDMALGVPTKMDFSKSNRPFVDWVAVRQELVRRGFIKV